MRESNSLAIGMYQKLGYSIYRQVRARVRARGRVRVRVGMYEKLGHSIYRQVIGYYSGEEDAFDMRKALSRDPEGKSCVPLNPLAVYPNELD